MGAVNRAAFTRVVGTEDTKGAVNQKGKNSRGGATKGTKFTVSNPTKLGIPVAKGSEGIVEGVENGGIMTAKEYDETSPKTIMKNKPIRNNLNDLIRKSSKDV
jgi:hypothetical protein